MTVVSFRSQTNGSIADFLGDEGLDSLPGQSVISSLAGSLLDYREEGVSLNPIVLYCTDVDAVVASFPGAHKCEIGTCDSHGKPVSKILKQCASLTSTQWHIYIQIDADHTLRYGVFNYLALPKALPVEEVISALPTLSALIVRRTSRNTIRLDGAKGHSLTMIFSTTREESSANANEVVSFAQACIAGLTDPPASNAFSSYFSQLLSRILNRCHGTIFVCGEISQLRSEETIKDAVYLETPLDFAQDFRSYENDESANAVLTLQRSEELLLGLTNSDGMVLFEGPQQ